MAEPTFPEDEDLDLNLLSQLDEIDPTLLAGLEDVQDEDVDPELAASGLSQYAINPEFTPERVGEMGELTDVGALLEGRERGMLDTIGENVSQVGLNMVTTDPMELADILVNRFPEDVDVQLSPDGVPVAINKNTGATFAINKPGFSPMDVFQAIGLIGQYAPAGKFAMAPLRGVQQGLVGEAKQQATKAATRAAAGRAIAGEGATEYGSQKLQEMAGGRMDPGEVAFTAVTAPVPELVATPVANMGRRVYDIAKDNVVIDDGIQKAIDYARDTGRKIATSDVLMETIKAPRRIFLKAAERIPLIGTSGMKLRQSQERTDTLESLFAHFGISGDTDYGKYIANNFRNQSARQFAESNRLRTEAFDAFRGQGNVVPRSMLNTIEDQLEFASKLEADQRRGGSNWLNSVAQDFDGLENFTFKDADTFLRSLEEGASATGPKAEMKRIVADALAKDMKRFETSTDTKAFNQWDLARQLGIKELKGVEDKALREALKTGEIHPGIVDRLLDQGRNKDIDTFLRRTDATGRDMIRKRTFANAIRRAGGDPDDISTVNIDTMIRALDKDPAITKGTSKYWTDADRKLVNGAKEYLRVTAKSAKAFESMGMLAAGASSGGGKRMITGMIAALLPPTQAIVAGARAHESDAARDLLLKLYAAEPASVEARAIMGELRPMLLAMGQQAIGEDRDPFGAEVEPTMFEKFIGGTGKGGTQIVESIGEFTGPLYDQSMEYLKSVTGIGEDEE